MCVRPYKSFQWGCGLELAVMKEDVDTLKNDWLTDNVWRVTLC